jgi:succinoglycan biosynthesis transport protein ExoP
MSPKYDVLNQLELETDPVEEKVRGVADHVILNKVSPKDPGDPLSDEMLHLAQSSFLSNTGRVPRLVVFCGVEEENGSSSVCAGAGRAIALLGAKTVCLVDAHIRTSRLSHVFGAGSSTIPFPGKPLSPREQCLLIQHNLFLAGTDMLFDSRGALLSPPDLKQRLKQLQDCFDYVLIDAPASSVCGDAIALGQIADAAILIIEANKTRRLIARRAKETLEASGVRLLGTVLRNQSFPIPKSLLKRL